MMEQKKFVLVMLIVALVCGGVSLFAPWWGASTQVSAQGTQVTSQTDYYGDKLVTTTTTKSTSSTDIDIKIRLYSLLSQRPGNAGVFENLFAASVGMLILLLIGLIVNLAGAKLRVTDELARLLFYLVGLVSLLNLVVIPFAISATTGQSFMGLRSETNNSVTTSVFSFPSIAYFALAAQFVAVGLIIYSYRYGVPAMRRRAAAPAPMAPPPAMMPPPPPAPAYPPGYTPTSFVPPPPSDQPPMPQAGAPMEPPRRSVLDSGQDVIPPAPPGR